MLFQYPVNCDTSREKLEAYEINIQRDFDIIQPYLPDRFISVLDIGCSMGGINVLLARHRTSLAVINLIDGDGIAPKRGGYHETVEPWNDVRDALSFVSENTKCSVRAFTPKTVPMRIHTDFIISLKSWCHHYSVDTYLALARNSLSNMGRMILDIRSSLIKETLDKLYDAGFHPNPYKVIYETPKCRRFVFERCR